LNFQFSGLARTRGPYFLFSLTKSATNAGGRIFYKGEEKWKKDS